MRLQQRPRAAVDSSTAIRRPRKCVVVLAVHEAIDEAPVQALTASLGDLGVETTYLGRETSADRIATAVVEREADAVEVCLAAHGGVLLLRALLRELIRVGRRDVSIVVHRM